MARPLPEIDAELAAIRRAFTLRWQALGRERRAAVKARDATILAAFDAFESAKEIAARLGLTINTVYGVLDRNGRWSTGRKTPISHLPAEQQRAYHKARHAGVPPRAARSMAQAVTT